MLHTKQAAHSIRFFYTKLLIFSGELHENTGYFIHHYT